MKRAHVAEMLAELAPPAPRCFDTRMAWLSWLEQAHDADKGLLTEAMHPLIFANGEVRFNHDISFCADCSTAYRSAMLKADRCDPSCLRLLQTETA